MKKTRPKRGSAHARAIFAMDVVERGIYTTAVAEKFKALIDVGFDSLTDRSQTREQWELDRMLISITWGESCVEMYRKAGTRP